MTEQELKAMEMALDALEWHEEQDEEIRYDECPSRAAMDLLRQALAQPEQKPYADKANQLNSDRMQIDPVTGDVSIGTPSKPEQELVAWLNEYEDSIPYVRELSFSRDNKATRSKPLFANTSHAPKPIAWWNPETNDVSRYNTDNFYAKRKPSIPLYTAPPSKPWVSLTDEEISRLKQKNVADGMTRLVSDFEYIRAIEAKLKEKNA